MSTAMRGLIVFSLIVSASMLFAATNPDSETIHLSCAAPAPLEGKYDPAALGYIVMFKNVPDATAEIVRLASLYAFKVDNFLETIFAFSAKLSPEVVAKLRCDPSVKMIERNLSVHVAENIIYNNYKQQDCHTLRVCQPLL
jgi:hypothetical protein